MAFSLTQVPTMVLVLQPALNSTHDRHHVRKETVLKGLVLAHVYLAHLLTLLALILSLSLVNEPFFSCVLWLLLHFLPSSLNRCFVIVQMIASSQKSAFQAICWHSMKYFNNYSQRNGH